MCISVFCHFFQGLQGVGVPVQSTSSSLTLQDVQTTPWHYARVGHLHNYNVFEVTLQGKNLHANQKLFYFAVDKFVKFKLLAFNS